MRDNRRKIKTRSLGMTLIEIMIVVAIIGGVMGLGAVMLFPSGDVRVRDEASRLAGTIRFIYNEAAIKNKYYRLHINLDENSYRVESSSDPFFVTMETEETLANPPEDKKNPEGEEGEAPPVPAFSAEESGMVKPVKFPVGVKFKDVLVQHLPVRVESGQVQSYFLPKGWAEPLVINLSDEDEENFYSLEVNPLTGKATIRGEYLEATREKLMSGEEE